MTGSVDYFERYTQIREEAIRISGNPQITLIAVSKRHPYETLRSAYLSGIREFGENSIQEGLGKIESWTKEFSNLTDAPTFHHIGPVQSGTCRKLFGKFAYTHGVGSISGLKELSKRSRKEKSLLRFFLQANLTGEDSKHGFDSLAIRKLLSEIESYETGQLQFAGLMTMGPSDEDPILTRDVFRELRMLRDELCPGKKLSMGMSGDFRIALEEGSDCIRIGSAIFGERNYGN